MSEPDDDIPFDNQPVVTRAMIQKLQDVTGSGMRQCFKALKSNSGDHDKALKQLSEFGQIPAVKIDYKALDASYKDNLAKAMDYIDKLNWSFVGRPESRVMSVLVDELADPLSGRKFGGLAADGRMVITAAGIGRRMDDGPRFVNVWFEPAYQNRPRWVQCRVDRHGVWRICGGNYIPEPRVDSLGRLNGSL